MKIRSGFILPAFLVLLLACEKKPEAKMAYEPIYEDTASLYSVAYQPQGQAVLNGGKIYLLGDTLYQVETDKGIHIIDISDKAAPKNTGFISIRGCNEVAVKGNTIYANNYKQLLSISLNQSGLSVLSRTPDAFVSESQHSLPPERGYFKCPVNVPGKIITGWRKVQIVNPQCYY